MCTNIRTRPNGRPFIRADDYEYSGIHFRVAPDLPRSEFNRISLNVEPSTLDVTLEFQEEYQKLNSTLGF